MLNITKDDPRCAECPDFTLDFDQDDSAWLSIGNVSLYLHVRGDVLLIDAYRRGDEAKDPALDSMAIADIYDDKD